MSCQDAVACVVEVADPGFAGDLRVCVPHVGAAQDTADRHDCHKVACQWLDTLATPCHHPQLWEHCHGTDKETAHPESVEEGAVVEVTVEQASKTECSNCKRH